MTEPNIDSLSLLLDLIRTGRAQVRPELQRLSGLGRGIVTERVSQLLQSRIVVEGELSESTGGRAARELHLRSDAGHLLVCHSNLTDFDVGIADLSGRLLGSCHERYDFDAGPEHMLARARSLWLKLQKELRLSSDNVWGVGIGIPAHIEFQTGTLVDSPSLPSNWNGYPVRAELSRAFNAPVWIETGENLLAIGELRAGSARGEDNFIYLFADMEVGSGIVLGGKLYRGVQGAAGNIGHITSDGGEDVVCRCGRRGCVEAVASGEAMIRRATQAARAGESAFFSKRLAAAGELKIADINDGVRQGDATAQAIVTKAGQDIGQALAAAVNILNPSLIAVGGRLTVIGDLFLASVKEALYRHSLPFVTRDLRVVRVLHTQQTGLIGAAHMVIDQLFSPANLSKWFSNGTTSGQPHLSA